MSRVQAIERAFAVLGALGDGPLGVTEVADARRAAQEHGRAAADRARRGRARSSRSRAAPTTASGADSGDRSRRAGRPTRSLVAAGPAAPRGAGGGGGRGGRPLDPATGTSSTTSTRWTARTRSASATGPARACRCTRCRPGIVILAALPPAEVDALPRRAAGALHAGDGRGAGALRERLRRRSATAIAWTADEVRRGHHVGRRRPGATRTARSSAAIHVHGPSYRFPADAVPRRRSLRRSWPPPPGSPPASGRPDGPRGRDRCGSVIRSTPASSSLARLVNRECAGGCAVNHRNICRTARRAALWSASTTARTLRCRSVR